MHSKNIATVNKPRSIERETLLMNSKDFNWCVILFKTNNC